MPLRIQRISVTPWDGLKLSGITIPQANPGIAPPFLESQEFRLHVRLRTIIWRPLVIKEVALTKPTVVWPQHEPERCRLPMTLRSPEPLPPVAAKETPAAPNPATPDEIETSPVPAAPPSTKVVRKSDGATAPQVKRVNLIDGSFHFLDHQNRNVALFDGVQFFSTMRDIVSIRGETRVAKIALRDRVFLSALSSPVFYDPTELDLSGIVAHVAKGELQGTFVMQTQAENSPFTVHANFEGVQADQVVIEAGGPPGIVRGVLEGSFDATGNTADALAGDGMIALRDGHVQQFSVLAAVGQLLQIEEMTQLDLQQAQAKFHLATGRFLVDELVLQSPNLQLTATGSVTFDGKLALDSNLTINVKIRGQLFRGIRENFVATAEPGRYALPFHVSGTVDRPRTDVMERAVGADLKGLGGEIDALLGRGKGQKMNKLAATTE